MNIFLTPIKQKALSSDSKFGRGYSQLHEKSITDEDAQLEVHLA